MTKDEFSTKIMQIAGEMKRLYPSLRFGQSVFNTVDEYIGVARTVQFKEGVDCFFNDDIVPAFLDKCWEVAAPVLEKLDVSEIDGNSIDWYDGEY